jgi:curli biogenesis system outer membrane secretion channel CsgG
MGMAAQLTTALTHGGNISVIESSMLRQQPDGSYTCNLQPGEIGPFIIKGAVTEFNETAEANEKTRGGSLGLLGGALGIAGAVTGKQGLAWTGAGVAAANPTYQNTRMTRSGMVGMDLQLVDARSRRIVRGYQCSGTFKTASATSGLSVFGIGGGDSAFAASALGQATRAAMNDALRQTSDALATAPR